MYILVTTATRVDPEDRELIEGPGEGAAAFIEAMYDIQEVVETVHVIDDYSDEPIELDLRDYFSTDIYDLPWGEREVTMPEMESCVL